MQQLRATRFETALGPWRLAATERGLCWLELDADADGARLARHAERRFGAAQVLEDAGALDDVRAALTDLTRGGVPD